ncbi:M56 family metallopeptidase [Granulicella arctica]|uniref:Uncharacterized protein (TIGR03435 family) n=1 Tax=Granulicella arctica TaxID=940613 RepID=A0A7Y9PFQ4_9BACT|nr:M56 family metallopeptidase [Granulicella arctica]NYF78870.1 uncharacterized protein (TIGR03435 family) [Granulicella arctica]
MNTDALAGMWTGVGDHLWQSTLFACVAGLLAFMLRGNSARLRYWLWLTASMKFLIPFSLLVGAGSYLAGQIHWTGARVESHAVMEEISQPFTQQVTMQGAAEAASTVWPHWIHLLPGVLAAIWLCGFVWVLLAWIMHCLRIYRVVRTATPLCEGREVEALRRLENAVGMRRSIGLVSVRDSLEPGIFGIFRPILLWPEGISQRLDDAQLEAILVHELCHVRRRDNLTAALHMVVEAVFWFHPLVWWMEGRLVEERERACDEEVLLLCGRPQVYAESILRVCEFCVESPLVCVSGVTGADLKKRMVRIMAKHLGSNLSRGRKMVLAALGLLAIAAPVAFGVVRMIPMYGQILHASGPLPSFEVASIRPWKPSSPPPSPDSGGFPRKVMMASPVGGGGQTTDRVNFIGQTEILIESAYNLPIASGRRIVGGPDWLYSQSNRYEIQAKIEDSLYAAMQKMTPAQQREQVDLMEQSLLADRFKLKVHFETREMPVYALVVAKSGSKLTPAEDGEPSNLFNLESEQGGEMTARAVTLDEFVRSPLLRVGGRLVVDQTGLKGRYDFNLKWRSEQIAASGAGQEGGTDAPSLFTAIQEQMGLKLVPTKGPVEVLVVDHIERPSAN